MEKLPSQEFVDEDYVRTRSTTLLVDPSNSNNPIDSVGEIHNEFLDAIAFNDAFETLEILDFLYEYSAGELGWEDIDLWMPQSKADSLNDTIWDYSLSEDFEGFLDDLSSAYSFSSGLDEHLDSLFSLFDYTREDLPTTDLIDSIKVREERFSRITTSQFESRIYYGTASILRYSAAYWDAVLEDETSSHPYYEVIVNYLMEYEATNSGDVVTVRKFSFKKLWRGLAVIGADALGFAGGYGLGSVLSGGNPAVGGAAGTLIGGAASATVRDAWD